MIALKKEVMLYKEEIEDYKINTIFIGGGTPSVLEVGQVEELMDHLHRNYRLSKTIEISIEANPGLLSFEKLKEYYSSGINRLSIGLQACQNHLLTSLGRIHQYEDFVRNLQDARSVGFYNINVDLMFGLPKQRLEDWYTSLKNVVDLRIPHISAYSLIIEEDTPFYQWTEEGKIQKPKEDIEINMYHKGIQYLKEKGYIHYEISNFAKPNHQCRHNITYWKNQQYLGLGAAAHSYLNQQRFNNHPKIEDYMEAIMEGKKPIGEKNDLSLKDEISETMFLGLRMMEGISTKEFQKRFNQSPFDIYGEIFKKLKEKQLIEYDSNNIKLTSKGIDLANIVFQEMLL